MVRCAHGQGMLCMLVQFTWRGGGVARGKGGVALQAGPRGLLQSLVDARRRLAAALIASGAGVAAWRAE